ECRSLLILGGHVSPWRAPVAESVPMLQRSYALGIESGDTEFDAYALANLVFTPHVRGGELDEVLEEEPRVFGLSVFNLLKLRSCALRRPPDLAWKPAQDGTRWLPYLRTLFF